MVYLQRSYINLNFRFWDKNRKTRAPLADRDSSSPLARQPQVRRGHRPSLAFSAAALAHQLADRRLTRRGCALCTDYQNAVQDLRCCCLPCRRGCVPGWLARVARERAQGVDGDGRGRRRVAGRARQGTGARTLPSRATRSRAPRRCQLPAVRARTPLGAHP